MKTETPSKLQYFWESHVNAWEETHLSQAAYCQKHELQIHRFGYWKRKLIPVDEVSTETQGFVQLIPASPHPKPLNSSLTLQLPNQLRIEGITTENLHLVKQLAGLLQ